ncbi:hypothetical protein KDW_12550 [Dictyobacter vulcani]|uniref:Protein kinase domain-containing protein n=1 Tax=Dictyobacter vulcani TaxID=2607529 RepID=A0A5J4KHB8_9CHLR|nr:hypothetical protein [Dictyobacter vulcani]GER87093.1 hypothetical protein KDW_12550 [Dictyobacter vulcani]
MSTNQRYLGPYELQQQLSSANQYESWKAFDRQQQRQVEITILHLPAADAAELVPRFLYETKNLTALNHPSIAKIYEVQIFSPPEQAEEQAGFKRTDACIVREYIEGSRWRIISTPRHGWVIFLLLLISIICWHRLVRPLIMPINMESFIVVLSLAVFCLSVSRIPRSRWGRQS